MAGNPGRINLLNLGYIHILYVMLFEPVHDKTNKMDKKMEFKLEMRVCKTLCPQLYACA